MPKHLASMYPRSGGCAHTAGIKIQLEYDLHIGQFLNVQIEPGKNNDKTFGTECLSTLLPSDLCIRDLGYYSLDDLDQMDQRGMYYISRPKLNNRVYIKNEFPEYFRNGTIKKQETLCEQIFLFFITLYFSFFLIRISLEFLLHTLYMALLVLFYLDPLE